MWRKASGVKTTLLCHHYHRYRATRVVNHRPVAGFEEYASSWFAQSQIVKHYTLHTTHDCGRKLRQNLGRGQAQAGTRGDLPTFGQPCSPFSKALEPPIADEKAEIYSRSESAGGQSGTEFHLMVPMQHFAPLQPLPAENDFACTYPQE